MVKRKKRAKLTLLKEALWELCKQISRRMNGTVCYTCGATDLAGSNWHTGHLWPKATLGIHLKYDLRVLRSQCNKCNMYFGGMGAEYYKHMLAEIGSDYLWVLEQERHISEHEDVAWYESKIAEYQKILSDLSTWTPRIA